MMCIDVTYELNSDVTEFAELVSVSKITKVKSVSLNANYSLGLNSPFSSYLELFIIQPMHAGKWGL